MTAPKKPGPAPRAAQSRSAWFSLVGAHQLAVGRDDVDRLDAHARRAVDAPVPAEAALQQVAAEADAGAVAGGEEQVVLGELREQLVARAARARRVAVIAPASTVTLVEARDVEQQPAVAHVVAGPAVAAGADADPHPLARAPCRTAATTSCLARGLDDHVRDTLRRPRVPDAARARRLVAVLAASQRPPLEVPGHRRGTL